MTCRRTWWQKALKVHTTFVKYVTGPKDSLPPQWLHYWNNSQMAVYMILEKQIKMRHVNQQTIQQKFNISCVFRFSLARSWQTNPIRRQYGVNKASIKCQFECQYSVSTALIQRQYSVNTTPIQRQYSINTASIQHGNTASIQPQYSCQYSVNTASIQRQLTQCIIFFALPPPPPTYLLSYFF